MSQGPVGTTAYHPLPAKAGTQAASGMDAQPADAGTRPKDWIPAFAGTSG